MIEDLSIVFHWGLKEIEQMPFDQALHHWQRALRELEFIEKRQFF